MEKPPAEAAQYLHPGADRWGGWHWRSPVRGEHFRRCSYCGSIHPQDLADEPAGWRAEWADWKYGYPHKFYVDIPNRNPQCMFVVGGYTGDGPPAANLDGWYQVENVTPDLWDVARRDGYGDARDDTSSSRYRWLRFGHRLHHHAKLYTAHLIDPAIPADAREPLFAVCGLRFYDGGNGRIGWHSIGCDCEQHTGTGEAL